jgi:hypothetical protein
MRKTKSSKQINNKKIIKNKTRKNKERYNPDVKMLKKGFNLYGAKNKNLGLKILDYTRTQELKKHRHCINENISWFAGLEQAKHYKGKNDEIFEWVITKPLRLIKITERNYMFFKNLFLKTKKNINPFIKISKDSLSKIDYEHPFLKMNNNEQALYEFEFIFGYISLKEQYEFLLLIKYLIKNNFINILSRHNTSLLPKIDKKINFYKLYPFGKKNNLNRISIYDINKEAVLNLCVMLYDKYGIDGVYQPNTNSYWYPDLIVYHMNIEEFILFSPHTELKL